MGVQFNERMSQLFKILQEKAVVIAVVYKTFVTYFRYNNKISYFCNKQTNKNNAQNYW